MYDYNSTHFDLFDNCFLPVTYKHFGILMNLHQQIIQYVNQTLISSGSTYTALACQNSIMLIMPKLWLGVHARVQTKSLHVTNYFNLLRFQHGYREEFIYTIIFVT